MCRAERWPQLHPLGAVLIHLHHLTDGLTHTWLTCQMQRVSSNARDTDYLYLLQLHMKMHPQDHPMPQASHTISGQLLSAAQSSGVAAVLRTGAVLCCRPDCACVLVAAMTTQQPELDAVPLL